MQAAPLVMQMLTELIKAIEAGGGTPTPVQAAQLAALLKYHGAAFDLVSAHLPEA